MSTTDAPAGNGTATAPSAGETNKPIGASSEQPSGSEAPLFAGLAQAPLLDLGGQEASKGALGLSDSADPAII